MYSAKITDLPIRSRVQNVEKSRPRGFPLDTPLDKINLILDLKANGT